MRLRFALTQQPAIHFCILPSYFCILFVPSAL